MSVCLAGGQKEVNVLNAELSLEIGKAVKIDGYTIERQCKPLYVDEIKEIVKQYDCLLSMACGAGCTAVGGNLPANSCFSGRQYHCHRHRPGYRHL